MSNLGNKMNQKGRTIGVKFAKGTKQLGNKIYTEMGNNRAKIRKLDNTVGAINEVAQFVPGMRLGTGVTKLVTGKFNKMANNSNLEKSNYRKTQEEKEMKSTVMKPGFF